MHGMYAERDAFGSAVLLPFYSTGPVKKNGGSTRLQIYRTQLIHTSRFSCALPINWVRHMKRSTFEPSLTHLSLLI